MTARTPRRAGALLLVVALMVAAIPAAAAPEQAGVEGSNFLELLAVWIVVWVPGVAPAPSPVPVEDGPGNESDGGPECTQSSGDDPTVVPQRGAGADPDG